MKKGKFYVPGILSLLSLLPLMLFQLSQWGAFEKQYVLDVTWHSPDLVNRGLLEEFPPPKKYTVINLTGSATDDKTKIDYAKTLIREILETYDTARGVRINFADTAKYHPFIDVLDFCIQQDGLIYVPYENDFWIFNRFKSEAQKNNLLMGGCIVWVPLNIPKEKDSLASLFTYDIDKRFWPVGLVFLVLVVGNFVRWGSVLRLIGRSSNQ